jgi:hypothetical protein
MGAKLGSTDVSFRLGAGEVAAVYLGTQEVWSAVVEPATLYYNGAVDFAWATVGNWWLDAEHTAPAGRLPAEIDSVVATASVTANFHTVVNFTITGFGEFVGLSGLLDGILTVTGMATFNGTAGNAGSLTGNATFNNGSANGGTVTGDAAFNDAAFNNGTVTGTVTCNTTGSCTPS